MKTYNPHLMPHYVFSKCCGAKTVTIPACFGDPEITLCKKCNKDCEVDLKPVYQEVSKGTFRLIEYANTHENNLENS